MFNKKAAAKQSRPDNIIEKLALGPGMRVADIGSGGGYFALRFADAVGPGGTVYAVDTNEEFLGYIKKNALAKGLQQVKTVLTPGDVVPLPDQSLDLLFSRNAYHHLEDRANYFSQLKKLLKPSGKLVIIEHKGSGLFSWHRWFGHHTPKSLIINELEQAGFRLVNDHSDLPKQHFLEFAL